MKAAAQCVAPVLSANILVRFVSVVAIAIGSGNACAGTSAETLYLLHCSGCHGADGRGDIRASVPPLPPYVGNFLQDPQGRLYVTNVGGVIGSGLSDPDTAAVLNWIFERFGGGARETSMFNAEEVRLLRAQRIADTVALRRQIAARLKKRGLALAEYPWP